MGIDVVLQQHRDAVDGSARALGLALAVERLCDRRRLRVRLEDRAQRGATSVQGVDPVEVGARERPRGDTARLHLFLEADDGRLAELEGLGRGLARPGW